MEHQESRWFDAVDYKNAYCIRTPISFVVPNRLSTKTLAPESNFVSKGFPVPLVKSPSSSIDAGFSAPVNYGR